MADPQFNVDGWQMLIGQIQQIRESVRELTKPSGSQLAQVVGYLTGANGSAVGSGYFSNNLSTNQHDRLWLDYDPTVDPSVVVSAPLSGAIRLQIFSWLYVGVNAYSSSGVGVNARYTATCEVLDPSGALVAQQVANAQLHAEVWGTNFANVLGTNASAQGTVTGLTPGVRYTVRARHGYYGYAHDGNSNTVTMPSGSWYKGTIGPITINVTPQ
jgi:hypothetical protein